MLTTRARPAAVTAAEREAVFSRLYTENVRSLLTYALRRVERPEDAADLVADTMLVAWRRLSEVPPGDEARLWLYGVARRTLANHHRTVRRRDRLGERLRDQLTTVGAFYPADDLVEAAVRSALTKLSHDDRELLQLTLWEGLAPREVAAVLGIPAGTVRTRLNRARTRLRAAIGDVPVASGHVRFGERLLAPEEGR